MIIKGRSEGNKNKNPEENIERNNSFKLFIISKFQKHLGILKIAKLLGYKISIPFQWCPL
jgi:hypothetical protein